MRIRSRVSRLLVGAAAFLTAGSVLSLSATAQSVGPRVVGITMVDSQFQPSSLIHVRKGETVKFVFRNRGKRVHEAAIGDRAAQLAHEKEMAAMGDVAMGDEPGAISVKAGRTKSMVWDFAKAGAFEIGCHEKGHYKAGMRIDVIVK